MKNIFGFIVLLFVIIILSGCTFLFENAVDDYIQNAEIDHFEQVVDDPIEILVGADPLPDFKQYVDRINPEGLVSDKDRFDVIMGDFDVNTIGTYTITYTFMSLDQSVEYDLTIYVVEAYSNNE